MPDSGLLDSWSTQGATQKACTARKELVRLLDSAARHPSSELNLSHCDAQACLELPDHLVDSYAEACTRADPPTIRLILPSGLTEVPGWVMKFNALSQLTAHGFTGDSDAALKLLEKKCPELRCDLSNTEGSTEHPQPVGAEKQLDVQVTLRSNLLRQLERPVIGTLDEDAKIGLRHFMDAVRDAVGPTLGSTYSDDFDVGGFKVVRSHDGELELLKLPAPPLVNDSLGPRGAENLLKSIEVFNTHFKGGGLAVAQRMSKCGYFKYLTAHAATFIDGEWETLVNIDPYFGRRPTQNVVHRDTMGENVFLIIINCSEDRVPGMEYQLRPENPPDYPEIMRRQLPIVFVDDVEDILKEPPEGTMYAPTIESWGFVAGCDELMAHSTPFVHHRGAFVVTSVIDCMGRALARCFGARAKGQYMSVQACVDEGLPPPPAVDQRVLIVHEVAVQLKERQSFDPWIDNGELEKLLCAAQLSNADAKRLVDALTPMVETEDPFDGTGSIFIPHLDYSGEMIMPRGKALRREMSEKLDNGTAPPYSNRRDYIRVWVMARPKPA